MTLLCSEVELAALAEAELQALPGWIPTEIERKNVAISIEDEREGQPRTLGLYQSFGYGADRMREITLYRRRSCERPAAANGCARSSTRRCYTSSVTCSG